MNKLVLFVGLSLLSLATLRAEESVTRIPGEKPGAVWSDSISAKVTVTAVDQKTRELTLKTEDGEEMTVVAGDEVKNFPQIKKGDIVNIDYMESVALFVRAPGDAPEAGEAAAMSVAAPGQKPGMKAAQTKEITATVVKINAKTREVTLKGQDGKKQVVKCGPEVKRFDQIKKGDQVVTRVTQAVAVSVRKP